MIFLKSYFVTTTKEINLIPIIHDVRYAIRDSQMIDGLVTITIPSKGASLLVTDENEEVLNGSKKNFKHMEGTHLSVSLPFQKKEVVLDPKQMIYLIDWTDSGKRREFYVQVLGDAPQSGQQQTTGRRR